MVIITLKDAVGIEMLLSGKFDVSKKDQMYLLFSVPNSDGGAYIHPSVQIEYFPGLGYGLKAVEVTS